MPQGLRTARVIKIPNLIRIEKIPILIILIIPPLAPETDVILLKLNIILF